MSNEVGSLTVSGLSSALATGAIKGTVNIFKAVAYLFAGLGIVLALGLAMLTYEETDENSYGVVDFNCTSDRACWEEQEALNDIQERRIGDLTLWGDFATEFENTLPAALNGDVESQIFIALLYANGEGVHQNFDKALEWVCKAVASNSFEAGKLYNKISLATMSDDYQPRQCNEY